MKKYIAIFMAALLAAGSVNAASDKTETEDGAALSKKAIRALNTKTWNEKAKYAFGLHTGVDIGAAVPWPLKNMESMNMSAVPKLSPALGVSLTSYPLDRFTATIEVTWKQVGIDAKARVAAQRFTLVDDNAVDPDDRRRVVEFRGTAYMNMAFSMLEIPIYVGYSFGDGRNRVVLGGYYSHVFRAKFETIPQKGMVIDVAKWGKYENKTPINDAGDLYSAEDCVIAYVQKPDDVPEGTMPDFNSYMDNWDAGFLLGYEWQVFPRINLSARFSMGLKDIFKKGNNYLDYKMLPMRGTVSVSYSFLRYTKK